MHPRRPELEALFAALIQRPGDPWSDLVSRVRSRLDPKVVVTALPIASGEAVVTATEDFEALWKRVPMLFDAAETDAALEVWAQVARGLLGRRAEVVDRRLFATDDPGRVPGLAKVIFGLEQAKLDQRDDLVDHDWPNRCRAAADAVAYVTVPRYFGDAKDGAVGGTAFLIDPSHVMTAFHVVEARDYEQELPPTEPELLRQIGEAKLAFNYVKRVGGQPDGTWMHGLTLAFHDKQLDIAVLKLAQPITTFAPVRFHNGGLPVVDDGLTFVANIVQHPNHEPKKIGLRNNAVWKVDDARLYYFTDTRGGSSGAPVFDDGWNVIAIHTGWEQIQSSLPIYLNRTLAVVNRGTRATKVVTALQNHATIALQHT